MELNWKFQGGGGEGEGGGANQKNQCGYGGFQESQKMHSFPTQFQVMLDGERLIGPINLQHSQQIDTRYTDIIQMAGMVLDPL